MVLMVLCVKKRNPPHYTQIPRKHNTHTRPLIKCTPNNLHALLIWRGKASEKTVTPTERHTWYDIHLHKVCAPSCTLPSTQASRKTDTKFQPLYASTSNKRCNLSICHDKAHKKTGHQKNTHPESDIHLHKVCASPNPLPYTQISRKHNTHPCPSSQEQLVVRYINRKLLLTWCCLQIAVLLEGQTKDAACKQHM